jgi:hypothetical protein
MRHFKGSILLSRFQFLDDRCTPEQKEELIKHLSSELRAKVQTGIIGSKWYPIEDYIDYLIVFKAVIGQGKNDIIVELGRYSAQKTLRGIYKLFVKIGSPEFYLKRISVIWKQIFDFGETKAVISKAKRCEVIVTGTGDIPDEFTHALYGWMIGTLEISGAKNVKVEILEYPSDNHETIRLQGTWT